MPTTPLSSALKSKQKELKLSVTKLAKAIGANVQSVTMAIKGKSVPNATTAPKYAKFLGLSMADFLALTKPAAKPAAKAKTAKRGKKAAKAKKAARAKPAKATKPSKTVTLAEAVELAADDLAVEIHRASAAQRRVVQAVLRA